VNERERKKKARKNITRKTERMDGKKERGNEKIKRERQWKK
jgi:hypothetical protein